MDPTVFYAHYNSFNPRPPRGGRRGADVAQSVDGHVSIHAPRAEGDVGMLYSRENRSSFNPRPPRGGRRASLGANAPGR